jgi:hypothetical protein
VTRGRRALVAAALAAIAAAAALAVIVLRERAREDEHERAADGKLRLADRPEPPTLDGLRDVLEQVRATLATAADPRAAAADLIDGWRVPAGAWPALVTEHLRPHHRAYVQELDRATPRLVDELVTLGAPAGGASAAPIEVRWQYADDPALLPAQVRLRVALPVGRPGAIAFVAGRPLSPIFAHDGRRWRVLAGLELFIVRHVALAHPACSRAYLAAAREPCLAMTAPIIGAALDDDEDGLERACTRLTSQCPRREP